MGTFYPAQLLPSHTHVSCWGIQFIDETSGTDNKERAVSHSLVHVDDVNCCTTLRLEVDGRRRLV